MAHFAKIENDIVVQVIVVNNEVLLNSKGVEIEKRGVDFCVDLLGGEWVQTSYNGNSRGKFAAIGDKYNRTTDEFEVVE